MTGDFHKKPPEALDPRRRERAAPLDRARRALRFAKRAIADILCRPGEVIAFLDQAPVGVGAASSPAVLDELAQAALGPLNRLPDDERQVLITTLRAWVACGGSAEATAHVLGCHPSAVRYRINLALQTIWCGQKGAAP